MRKLLRIDMAKGICKTEDVDKQYPNVGGRSRTSAIEIMSHRERVLAALNHQQPDRMPMDLGGYGNTSITVPAYKRLKAYLGIEAPVIIADMMMQTRPIQWI